jgi:hypothetical protein
MTYQWTTATNLINLGSSPNSGDGDSIRVAFAKVNNTFLGLFTATATVLPATNSVAGVVIPGTGLSVAPDGTLSVTGAATTSTVNIIDNAGSEAIDIRAYSGSFTLPSNTSTFVSLFTFSNVVYRGAEVDIIANNTTDNTLDSATSYMITYFNGHATTVGMSPTSVNTSGAVTTAIWEIGTATVNTATNGVSVNLYNVSGSTATNHVYTWRAKVTLFRL